MPFVTPASIPCLLDRIFGQMEDVSRIRIDCCDSVKGAAGEPGSILEIKVNGQSTALRYLHFLEAIVDETIQELSGTITQIAPGNRTVFFKQAERRIRQISHSVSLSNRNRADILSEARLGAGSGALYLRRP